ncbi:DUF998 domain-containing protein [Pyrococcus sp. ST04]|uniref:DUF998 domain-containing protein n=1 Tax=Pyrococcus sp. ST04 TaxID=1183377 RepID=UPI00064ECD8A|nr:DUF998 domain-containing protein [Pyrococcus sp. ST04]
MDCKKDVQYFLAILGPVIAISGVIISYFIHRSWWRITENAISDLGRVGLPYSWIMNGGLIIGGSILFIISIRMTFLDKRTPWKISWFLYSLGMMFLVLVGAFPEGTPPHYYVSWTFFISTFLAVLGTSISLLPEKRRHGIVGILAFVLGTSLAIWAMKSFRGVAVAETISVTTFILWHYFAVLNCFCFCRKL